MPRDYDVRFTVRVPDGIDADAEQVKAWLRFYLHDTGSLAGGNPLVDYEPEPIADTFYVSQRYAA